MDQSSEGSVSEHSPVYTDNIQQSISYGGHQQNSGINRIAAAVDPIRSEQGARRQITCQDQKVTNEMILPKPSRPPLQRLNQTSSIKTGPVQAQKNLIDGQGGHFQTTTRLSRFIDVSGRRIYPESPAPPPHGPAGCALTPSSGPMPLPVLAGPVIPQPELVQSRSTSGHTTPVLASRPYGSSESPDVRQDVPLTPVAYQGKGKPRWGRATTTLNPGRDPTAVQSPANMSAGRGRRKITSPAAIAPRKNSLPAASKAYPASGGLASQLEKMSVKRSRTLAPDMTDFKSQATRDRERSSSAGRSKASVSEALSSRPVPGSSSAFRANSSDDTLVKVKSRDQQSTSLCTDPLASEAKVLKQVSTSVTLPDHVGVVGKVAKSGSQSQTEDLEDVKHKEEMKVVPAKFPRPNYSQEEKQLLYADKKFVIDMSDAEKSPADICIWQILHSSKCLLQYYPCKHRGEQYYQTGIIKWYFTSEDFLGEEFYERFQPIIVIIANTADLGPPHPNWPQTHTEMSTVQYVFSDSLFFNRMIKYMHKIQHIDTTEIRIMFMGTLKALTLLIFHPDLLTAIFGNPEYEVGKMGWVVLREMTNKLLDRVSENFSKKTFNYLRKFPALYFIYQLNEAEKTTPCTACLIKCPSRVPCVKVSFDGSAQERVPYDPDTHLELGDPAKWKFPQGELWCARCSENLKKIHRLAHFWYNLWRLIKQNVIVDIENARRINAPVTDDLIVWIQSGYINWKNVMLADFQLTYAEVEDQIVEGNLV